jgi:hypothetical protein
VAQLGAIPSAAVRDDTPDANDYGVVVRIVGGIVIPGPIAVTQDTTPWVVSDPTLEAAIDVALSTRASEATLTALAAMLATQLDVALSTRASEATVAAILAALTDGSQHTIVDNFPATQPVSGPLTNAELRAAPVETIETCDTSTPTNVVASVVSVTLAAANAARRGLIVVNDSSATLYIKFGITASDASYTYRLNAGATLECSQPIYTGRVDAIWSAATGNARVTELT